MRALLLASIALALGCSAVDEATTSDDASAADGSTRGETAPAADVGQLDAITEHVAQAGTGGSPVLVGSGGAGGVLAGDAGPVGGAGAGGAQQGSGGAAGGPGSDAAGAGGAAVTFPACSDPEAARIGSTNCVRRQPDPDGFFSPSRKGGLTCALCSSYQANGLPLHYVRGCALGGTYCVASSCNECE